MSNGIANLTGVYAALVGVFLDGTQPDLSGAPPALDFSVTGLGTDFASPAPALKQPFFIGDGRTAVAQQRFFRAEADGERLLVDGAVPRIRTNDAGDSIA